MQKYAIVTVGASGVGKTTVAEALIEKLGTIEMSRSATTRAKRGDGKDAEYIYLTREEFEESLAAGDILEYTDYGAQLYGTRRVELERIWQNSKNPILVLDYVGARSVKEKLEVPAVAVYVYSPLDKVKARLEKREENSSDKEKSKARIVDRMKQNIADYKKLVEFPELFDLYVENDEIDACVDRVIASLDDLIDGKMVMSADEKREITENFRKDAFEFEEKHRDFLYSV